MENNLTAGENTFLELCPSGGQIMHIFEHLAFLSYNSNMVHFLSD